MGDPDVWPAVLDMSRDDCKRILRRLELEAYSNLVSVLRAQGTLTAHKRRLLKSVAQTLSISEERHKAECRRAVNSEKLATIAMHMSGANTGTEWAIEGRRLVPLLPRLVPQTAFTAIADKVANMAVTEGAKLPLPTPVATRRLQSPLIDETLLEPNIPEASKTVMVSSVSPLPVESIPTEQPVTATASSNSKSISPVPSLQHATIHSKLPMQGAVHTPISLSSAAAPALCQANTQQAVASIVKYVKQEESPLEEHVSRKRQRSASVDDPSDQDNTPVQNPLMPPPVKKEALSPVSPQATPHVMQHSPTMSPQSHSQLVQQQTLQAAAAAAAAVSASPCTISPAQHQALATSQSQITPVHTNQQLTNLPALPQTSISTSSGTRTVTIPTQGTVKLCLGPTAPTSGTGISPGTHKVIIVSSTAPSILQRSLSVPVVKTLTTSASSLPSSSVPIQTQPSICSGNGNNTRSNNPELMTGIPSSPASGSLCANVVSAPSTLPSSTAVPSKPAPKVFPPKARARANSIVIPVTPNPANVLGSMSAAGMQLKTALQASKQAVLKAGDSTGLKILPLTNVPPNAKILPKPAGPGPIYVVSSTSVATQNMSVVTRNVPSGARVMTFSTSSLPRVAVSTSQGGTILSMSPKPVQTLQLAQGNPSVATTGSASPKPNVIVVQKGASAFGRATTLSQAGKDVVAKVLLGGKGLASLSQSHGQAPALVQASTAQALAQPVQIMQSQVSANHSSQSPGVSQVSQTSISSPPVTAASRMVTFQKLPSSLVSGSAGTSNVIVFDLSQEQFNSSSVLNEIFATSSILGAPNSQSVNPDTAQGSRSSPNSNYPAGSLPDCNEETNVIASDGSNNGTVESSPTPISNTCTDIFSAALSNVNLNLNDFLEDSSLDGAPSTHTEVMRLGLSSVENNSNSSHSNASLNPSSWVCSENSQNSMDSPDSNQV